MAIPPMDENLKQLLSAFNANRVRYVVIGGYAVFVHAQPRMTKDMASGRPQDLADVDAIRNRQRATNKH